MIRLSTLSLRFAVAAAIAVGATQASASPELVNAIVKVANPHALHEAPLPRSASPLRLTSISAAGLVDQREEVPSALASQGLYTFKMLKDSGDWEAASYLATELREFAAAASAVDARAVRAADLSLPDHVLPVVYPSHVLDTIENPQTKAAVLLCGIKAPSYSASRDPRLRTIGREIARQCASEG